MNAQELITYWIIVVSTGFAGFKLYHILIPGKSRRHGTKCSADCKCEAAHLRKELLEKHKNKRN
jgi:hypothetical protein